MVHTSAISVAAAALLCALPASAGLYSKSSPVVQIDGKNYDRLIAQSNYTSIVEFYAPWCGHCKNLQPAYEKAAKNLDGLAKVAAVDCDDDSNKAFCGGFGVQGFPTLKIVKPGNTPGKPIVEDYQGPRTAKGIVDAVIDKMPNLVKKVEDKSLESFLAEANDTAKAILFTEKGTTSALLKAVALEFKGSVKVAQIRDKNAASVELFGITNFPTLLLLPGGSEAEGVVYDGELKKDPIVKFLSQVATPNPDPAPPKVKLPKGDKGDKKAKASFESASASHKAADGSSAAASATEEVLEEETTESPSPEVDSEKPAQIPAPPIPILFTEKDLQDNCLGSKTGTCILALLPAAPDEVAAKAISSLSEVAHRYKTHARKLFPFYVVPKDNGGYEPLKARLSLGADTEIIVVNARRGWWKHLPSKGIHMTVEDVSEEAVETWVDSIRLGEGAKQDLPEVLIVQESVVEEPAAEEPQAPIVETETTEPAAQETPAEATADLHDEL